MHDYLGALGGQGPADRPADRPAAAGDERPARLTFVHDRLAHDRMIPISPVTSVVPAWASVKA